MAARRAPPTPPWATAPSYRDAERPPPPSWSAAKLAARDDADEALMWRARHAGKCKLDDAVADMCTSAGSRSTHPEHLVEAARRHPRKVQYTEGTPTPRDGGVHHPLLRTPVLPAGSWSPPLPPPAPRPGAGPGAAAADPRVLHDLMPLLWTLRLLLIFPVTHDGRAVRFRWRSWTTLITAVAWLALCANSLAAIRFRLAPVLDPDKNFHVWDLVPKIAITVGMSVVFVLPLTCWATAPRAIAFIEQFQRLEVQVAKVSGPVRLQGLRWRSWALSVISLLVSAVMQAAALAVLPDVRIWMLPSLLHSGTLYFILWGFWVVICSAFASYCQQVTARIPADLQRLGPPQGLRAHREIWLGLAQLLSLLGDSLGRIQTMLIGVLFVIDVAVAFTVLHFVLRGIFDRRFYWSAPVLVFMQIAIISICNAAQVATDGVREDTVRQLLAMSLVYKDGATCHEIIRFLDDIHLENPHLSACRLSVLNRASTLSFFSLACTYLVVLSQFTVSSESSTTDFVTPEPFADY
ncbi:Gustatory and odorant receptor 21a [Frankliniella fusca]|uniref:Gustatory receptor n=1 Tax=Frankliniella fusca TaxID=407009 RepID=A0AAE1HTK9_9NEOP|nr:Gustatory and odorant receptor 21a [Frankliniella fusca]